jgi:hypothetical protein
MQCRTCIQGTDTSALGSRLRKGSEASRSRQSRAVRKASRRSSAHHILCYQIVFKARWDFRRSKQFSVKPPLDPVLERVSADVLKALSRTLQECGSLAIHIWAPDRGHQQWSSSSKHRRALLCQTKEVVLGVIVRDSSGCSSSNGQG